MSVILAIEQKLISCNQARFEKIAGAYLKARGISGIALLGTVEGKDKTRTGVPDAYATDDGRRFRFLACTTITGNSAVKAKLIEDIEECSNEEKTGIPTAAIDTIYLAFNSNLLPATLLGVAHFAESKRVRVEFLSLSEIALDLQRQYGWLARDELGVALDTGQLLPMDQFIREYDRGRLATPLDTTFRFRDDLVKEGISSIGQSQSVLLITGPAGTGKTRLALEIAKTLSAQGTDLKTYCLFNKDLAIAEDLHRYCSEPGNYLFLVDDANRVNGRAHVLNLIKQADSDRSFRFILTVRDYAEDEVSKDIRLLGVQQHKITVGILEREQINEYLVKEFGITNEYYQRQIWQLSKGNARLATMAAKEAVKTSDISSIRDVTDLYELYYSDITSVLIEDGFLLLKVLGIVSVLRHVRQRDEQTMALIADAFGISKQELWLSIDRLHELEIVNLHGREVAKVSDQILATFGFYLCFIKHEALPFEKLLKNFSKSSLKRIRDSVYAACNTMSVDAVRKVIDSPVLAAIKDADSDEKLRLLDVFWFVDVDMTLATLMESFSTLPNASDSVTFQNANATYSSDPYLSILSNFRNTSTTNVATAIDLALLYLDKNTSKGSEVLKLLTESSGFGINRESHGVGYVLQKAVVDRLQSANTSKLNRDFLLIEVAKNYLGTEFDATYSEDHRSITWCRVHLSPESGMSDVRRALWQFIRQSLLNGHLVKEAKSVLQKYARDHSMHGDDSKILKEDILAIAPVISLLDRSKFLDCLIVQTLHRRFLRNKSREFVESSEKFTCPAFELLRLTTDYFSLDRLQEENYESVERKRKALLLQRYGSLVPEELPSFIANCLEIVSNGSDRHGGSVKSCVIEVFESIARVDAPRALGLTKSYLELGDPLEFGGWSWIPSLVRSTGKEAVLDVINSKVFERQGQWLLSLYLSIEESSLEALDVNQVLKIIKNPDVGLPLLASFKRFSAFVPKILVTVVKGIFETRDEHVGTALRHLLDHPHDHVDWIRDQFIDDIPLLKKSYLVAQGREFRSSGYFDFDARLFELILEMDSSFIAEYVTHRYSENNWLSGYEENHRDYARLWKNPNWISRFLSLVDTIAKVSTDQIYNQDYLCAWFPQSRGEMVSTLSLEAMDIVIAVIKERAQSGPSMRVLFGALVELDYAQRLELFKQYVDATPIFEEFKELPLTPTHMSGVAGDIQNQYADQIRFMEGLRELLPAGMDYVAHRAFINKEIRSVQSRLEWEQERSFISDD